MSTDNDELNSILSTSSAKIPKLAKSKKYRGDQPELKGKEEDEDEKPGKLLQWTTPDGNIFIPAGKTVKVLEPGIYDIGESNQWGIYFQKLKTNTHNLIKFPDSRSEQVITEIEHFWERKEAFKNRGDKASIMYKRGICLWGPPGCFAKGTKTIMFDGTIKNVEDVKVGDVLMGDDSTPRKVLELKRGKEQMYEVKPIKGDSYVVNQSHVLSVKRHGRTSKLNLAKTDVVDIKVSDWLKKSNTFKEKFKGYRTDVKFKTQKITVDPYYLGYWLGDGTTRNQGFTTADKEIVTYTELYADRLGLRLVNQNSEQYCQNKKAHHYNMSSNHIRNNGKNILLNQMNALGVINNKHVPYNYKINSREVRLQILAGLLDSDGSYNEKGSFDFINKNKTLSEDVVFICRSLGLSAYVKECKKRCVNNGVWGTYWRVCISGNLNIIPTKIERKQAHERKQIKDVLVTGIKLKKLKVDDFYGFTLDGNHRFLLNDFTVVHNSGKTCTVQLIVKDVIEKRGGICVIFGHPKLFLNGMRTLRQIHPDTKIVVLMEDLDSIIEQHDESEVLNILDGVNAFEDIVYLATTNYPERLGPRIINRPSRFDKRIKIGFPNAACRKIYLESLITAEEIKKHKINIDMWVKDTDEFSMAHLKELFVAVVILEDPYKEALKNLNSMKGTISSDDTTGKLGFIE